MNKAHTSESIMKKGGLLRFDQSLAPENTSNPNQRVSKGVITRKMINNMKEKAAFDENLERKYESNFNKWKEYDLLTAIIAVMGLALSIVDYEYSEYIAEKIVHKD